MIITSDNALIIPNYSAGAISNSKYPLAVYVVHVIVVVYYYVDNEINNLFKLVNPKFIKNLLDV